MWKRQNNQNLWVCTKMANNQIIMETSPKLRGFLYCWCVKVKNMECRRIFPSSFKIKVEKVKSGFGYFTSSAFIPKLCRIIIPFSMHLTLTCQWQRKPLKFGEVSIIIWLLVIVMQNHEFHDFIFFTFIPKLHRIILRCSTHVTFACQ